MLVISPCGEIHSSLGATSRRGGPGDRPGFFPLDLRPFVNHTGRATGKETLEPGRMPAIDLRYVPTGRQIFSGVEFDLIDPAENNGKSILTLGRPTPSTVHPKDAAAVMEETGPIPVGRKVASLAFLRWMAGHVRDPLWHELAVFDLSGRL